MGRTVPELRYRARMCRDHAKGREEDVASGLKKLADDYDDEADGLEGVPRKPRERL